MSMSQQSFRDTAYLYTPVQTINCAMNGCVPCGYKIGLFDVALDKEFCKQVPNQRPEQCPRLYSKETVLHTQESRKSTGVLGFRSGMSILTVGDGDFTFSLALARIIFGDSQSKAPKSTLIATSYEREETLRRVYPDFGSTLKELHNLGARTCYQVDATQLRQSLPNDICAKTSAFHRICWNFPCTAIAKGQDGQNDEMERNKELVRGFVTNATPMLLAEEGEIHICHKTKPPFNQWSLEHIALEHPKSSCILSDDIDRASLFHNGKNNAMKYVGKVVLDRAVLQPYTPRKALDRKSFPCHDACIYVFSKGRSDQEKSMVQNSFSGRFPPTVKRGEDSMKSSGDVVPVTSEMIEGIRTSLLRKGKSLKRKTIRQKSSKRRKVQ